MPAGDSRSPSAAARATRIVAGALLGSIAGTMAGGMLGFAIAIGWSSLMHESCPEGDCASLAVFALMPGSALVGGAAGAAGFGIWMARVSRRETTGSPARR